MSEDLFRNEFKKVEIKNTVYLYPYPVIKNAKYLIEIEKEFEPFFIQSFKNKYLASPDSHPPFLIDSHLHEDGATKIYTIKIEDLCFNFLPNRANDLAMALKTEQIISKKIIDVLMRKQGSKINLKRIYENQLKCSSCQSLGIESNLISDWINLL